MDTPTFRQRLALRLEEFPLLRTLVLDGAFSIAFFGIVAVGCAVAIAIPKIWRTTPDGFRRSQVRVSLIDLAQAWSLKRSALRYTGEGRADLALQSWRAAVFNNLGDQNLHRGLLQHLRSTPEAPSDQVVLGLFSGAWLLALNQTNIQDVALYAEVLEKYRMAPTALEWIGRFPANAPELESIRARCLLSTAQGDAFAEAWGRHAEAWARDPNLQIYHDAWQAGWETGTRAIEAMIRLKAGLADPGNLGLTAARLLILSGARRGVPEDLELALARLRKGRADAVGEHVAYWRFLVAVGRFQEAQDKAKALQSPPRLALEAAEYADALATLGLRDAAIDFLEGCLPRFQANPVVWEVFLTILADGRRWSEVRRAAAQVRTETASFETARILGIFAEYRADVAEHRRVSADSFARQLVESRILDNPLALRIASEFVRDQRPAAAVRLLKAKQPEMGDHPRFWIALLSAAMGARDIASISEASVELVQRRPNDPIALSNRAAVLMGVEKRPAEALELTLRLVQEYPNSDPFRINHAFALLLNQRFDEAWAILQRIDPARLETQASSAYYLAVAEVHWARAEFDLAGTALARVQQGLLLPPQADRVAEMLRTLQQRSKG